MAKFVVRLGYDWVIPTVRDIEVDAVDEKAAARAALVISRKDPDFWTAAQELDGEAGPTEVVSIEQDGDDDVP